MAIIKPSLKFEGAETGQVQNTTPYIKEHVKKVVFNKTTNQQGTYLYFLPGYRADSRGEGVWYKAFELRDNFGDKYKEKYYVPNRQEDPATYFANHYDRIYGKEEATTVNVNGKQFKKYPNFGRITKRQIFNVAYANNLEAGVHVLDLPSFNGANQLHDWLSKTDISGNPRHPINDPERAVPVFVQLKDNSANPWYLNVEASQPVILPDALADSDNLYNLDEILVPKSKDEIISKLREMYSSEVFEDCMDGYPGLVNRSRVPGIERISGGVTPVAAPVAAPVAVKAAPAIQPLPAAVPINTTLPKAVPVEEADSIDMSSLPPNPMAKMTGSISKEQAMSFLAK